LLAQAAAPVQDAIYFHAQQCIEKYLKASLQEANIAFRRTHDLEELLAGKSYLKETQKPAQEEREGRTMKISFRVFRPIVSIRENRDADHRKGGTD
jgi:HEPN domain-containing protein